MTISGQIEWGNENEGRSYPLREDTTGRTDDDLLLPSDILADLSVIVPASFGEVYCTAVRVTPALYSIAIGCEAGGLLAGTVLRSDYPPFAAVPLTPLVEDVNGWVAFGDHRTAEPANYVFSGPEQSGLAERVVRRIDQIPVRRFLKLGGTASSYVDKLVQLIGGWGLTVTKRDANTIVLGLAAGHAKRYVGPCELYADSGDCNFEPIRKLSGVTADDDGVITLRFVPYNGGS